jgi:hypothetical protein
MMPRARGSGSRILKRTSHIRIILSDEIPIETRATRKAKRRQEEKAAKKDGKTEASGEKPATSEKRAPRAKKSGKAKPKK